MYRIHKVLFVTYLLQMFISLVSALAMKTQILHWRWEVTNTTTFSGGMNFTYFLDGDCVMNDYTLTMKEPTLIYTPLREITTRDTAESTTWTLADTHIMSRRCEQRTNVELLINKDGKSNTHFKVAFQRLCTDKNCQDTDKGFDVSCIS
ncbi:hypothetical protein CROQUDRAFT_715198, partial [Cronartium quercuum f. sp. fusiforme G11]